jgi:hypothetical protein
MIADAPEVCRAIPWVWQSQSNSPIEHLFPKICQKRLFHWCEYQRPLFLKRSNQKFLIDMVMAAISMAMVRCNSAPSINHPNSEMDISRRGTLEPKKHRLAEPPVCPTFGDITTSMIANPPEVCRAIPWVWQSQSSSAIGDGHFGTRHIHPPRAQAWRPPLTPYFQQHSNKHP